MRILSRDLHDNFISCSDVITSYREVDQRTRSRHKKYQVYQHNYIQVNAEGSVSLSDTNSRRKATSPIIIISTTNGFQKSILQLYSSLATSIGEFWFYTTLSICVGGCRTVRAENISSTNASFAILRPSPPYKRWLSQSSPWKKGKWKSVHL